MGDLITFPSRDRIEVTTARDDLGHRIYLLEMIGVDEFGRRFRSVIESAHELSELADLAFYWERWGTPVN